MKYLGRVSNNNKNSVSITRWLEKMFIKLDIAQCVK
jgi:hypothetical protein